MALKSTFKGAALAVLLAAGFAPVAGAETLPETLSMAYNNNPDLRAQRAALRATDEQVAQGNFASLPTLNGSAFYQRSSQDTFTSTMGQVGNDAKALNRQLQLRVDQPLFNGFQRIFNRKQAKALVMAGRATLLQVEQNVLLSAATVFMDVLRDLAIYDLNQNNVQVLNRQLEASQDRFRVGEITRTDVAQSEAGLAGAVSGRITSQANLAGSRATYRQVVGQFPGTLTPDPEMPPMPPSLEEAWVIAQAQNPQVLNAMYIEEAAKHAVSASKGNLLPSANGFLTATRFIGTDNQAGVVSGNFTTETKAAGVNINIPFFNNGTEHSAIRANKQVRSQRKLEALSADLSVRAQTETAWVNHEAAQAAITSNQSQVDANAIALEGVRQEESVGARTVLDVLNAEQALLNSRVNLVTAERDEYVAGFTLLQALGQLNAAALDLPVDLYDPEENYKNVRYKFWGWGTKDYD